MSEEDEKKVTQWFLEARSDRSLSKTSAQEKIQDHTEHHGITRGAGYYGGKRS